MSKTCDTYPGFNGRDGDWGEGRWNDDPDIGLAAFTFNYGGLAETAVMRLPSKLRQCKLSYFMAVMGNAAQTYVERVRLVEDRQRLENATGVQLDNIGTIVNLARNGLNDEQYKLFLSVRALVLGSDGTFDVIAAIARTLFDDDFAIHEDYPLAFVIFTNSDTPVQHRSSLSTSFEGCRHSQFDFPFTSLILLVSTLGGPRILML